MRRLLLVVSMVVLAGCNRDMFKAGAGVAAVAGSAKLSPERLADFVLEAKGAQLNNETADFITNVWVDYSLFAQAIAKNQVLTDSATVAQAMWPQITELKATLWHDSLMAKRINVTPDAVSQAYNGNDVRIFQHVLIRSSATATPEEKAAAKKQAQKAISAVKGGAPFAQVASQVSQDPGSARDGGYLPPGPQRPVRSPVRQRRVGPRPGRDERPGRDAVRHSRHPAPAPHRGAGPARCLPAPARGGRARLALHGQPRRPAEAEDREGRAHAHEGRDQQPGQEQPSPPSRSRRMSAASSRCRSSCAGRGCCRRRSPAS